jgi:hypothetical protein
MKRIICLLALLAYNLPCLASVLDDYEVVNFAKLPRLEEKKLTNEDVMNIVPINKLREGDDGNDVSHKILDQSVNSFLKSDYVQNSSLGKTAKSVEDGVRTDISFGSKDSKIKHKVSFQYQAFQQEAKLGYRGLLNLNLKYNFSSNDYLAEIVQDIDGKEIVLGHEVYTDTLENYQNDKSSISMRWTW